MGYDNRQRREAARSTRARIIAAAKDSFLERGFGATTVRQVAAAAGTSQETIYKTFGSKAALLKSVYDVSLAGDDEDVPLAARPEAIAVGDAPTPALAAAAYSELAGLISGRVDPLLRVLLGSRGVDPALAEFAATTDTERHIGSSFFVGHWAARGWIRPELTTDRAADALWALNAPEHRWLLMDRGWSDQEYTHWLARLVQRAILVDEPPT